MNLSKNDFKNLISLAIPLILSGLMESSIGFISSVFLAKLGPLELAAGSLASWGFATLMIIMWGLLTAVSVLVSRYFGAKDTKAIGAVLRDAIFLGLILVIPSTLLIWNAAPILTLLGQKAAIVSQAVPYLHALAWGILPDFISLILLQFIIGLGQTRINLIFTLAWVPVNVMLNYVFTFGKFGFPALGMAGLGWGTTASYWILALLLIAFMGSRKIYRPYLKASWEKFKPTHVAELFKVGLPMGLMYALEIGFFFTMALIMGQYGIKEIDANQITMQYLGLFVTVVFATAQAVTVRMGHQIGAKNYQGANRAAYAGLILSFGLTFLAACSEWFLPRQLIAVDLGGMSISDSELIALTIQFLAIAAVFQLTESLRITLFGALRALEDTRFTLFTSFIAFWCIAIPMGFMIDKLFHFDASSYWVGLTLSGMMSVSLLYWRFRRMMGVRLEKESVIDPI